MVAAKDEEVLRVLDFVSQEQTDGLERLLSSIHIVAEKDVVGFGGESAVFKQTEEVVVLTVDVTANFDWGFKFKEHWLGDEEVPGSNTQHFHRALRDSNLLPWTSPTH